ncbi:Fic family protein [Rodentibacter haemolyticus]|uniref:Protein adenylyltransferase n=1 Tax=Rodentibacter haemolyticus TaxID=2778911 RepID=A0ABX6UW43_9PAST|nr:Fic/DOC family N-terminal domain-containing protein [Rodentibacter haemolyticus]QPB42308.1 Fic family protein [Rodentibacter haemolyticus]
MENAYRVPDLFSLPDVETKAVLKAANLAHQALGELKGIVNTMPNQDILLSTLPLQEAKDSSEIENIITTQDDMYASNYETQHFSSLAAKEVHRYAQAMQFGFQQVKTYQLLTLSTIKNVQQILENNNAGFRCQAGTKLIDQNTGKSVYTPPQSNNEIEYYMGKLALFINDSEQLDYDPLVKMAIIHHQFESIHPFYDGNGRTGRIINILYLVLNGLLDKPILYLSRYINQNKREYYYLLQEVRDTESWEKWLLFMLKGIEKTAKQTLNLVTEIKSLMQKHKKIIKDANPKLYSHELINNLYKYPYTKVEFLAEDCEVHRNTALKRLTELELLGIVKKTKIGRESFYVNQELFELLAQ